MKQSKKILVIFFTLVMSALLLISLSACDTTGTGTYYASTLGNGQRPSNSGGNDVAPGVSDVEISNFDYGFIEEENYKDRETTMADTTRDGKLKIDTVYYCLVEFDFNSRTLNNGTSLMNVIVKLDNLGVIDGTTQEADTGNVSEMIFTDAETGNNAKTSSHAYKIPSDPNNTKRIRLLIRLLPVSIDISHISVSFEPIDEYFKVLGDDGVYKNLEVVRAQLDAPVISVDRNNLKLKWNHVKNADAYIIHFADQTITYSAGIDEYTAVGTELSFNLSEFSQFGIEYGDVKVQAIKNSTNFISSFYSNIETDIQL